MSYISDPTTMTKYSGFLEKQDKFREHFATLGRTTVKGYEGKTFEVNGVSVTL